MGERADAARRSCGSRTAQGNILWQPRPRREPGHGSAARLAHDRRAAGRGPARHRQPAPVGARLNFPAGGKTGTTNDGNDVWFIGFTPDLVTGIWIGFDQPKKIKANAQGGVLAAPAWTTMMREVYERRSTAAVDRPEDLQVAEIDRTTGFRATPFCPTAAALHGVVRSRHRARRRTAPCIPRCSASPA